MLIGARLGTQLLDHRRRRGRCRARRRRAAERQGDAAGADAELEGRAVAGEGGEEVDGRIDDRGFEHRRTGRVVSGGDSAIEAVLCHRHTVAQAGNEHRRGIDLSSQLVCDPLDEVARRLVAALRCRHGRVV